MNEAAAIATGKQFTTRYFVTLVVVTLVYVGAAKFGLSLAFATKQVTAFWPPTGIAVAALLLVGYRLWPAVFLGALVVNATTGEPLLTAAGIAVGNTLGPLVTVFLLRRFGGFDNSFARVRDALGLCLCGAIGMTVTASNGVANLALAGIIEWSAVGSVWWVWWVGDTMGVLVVAPLLLAWAARPRPDYTGKQLAELCALLLGLVVLGLMILAGALIDSAVLTSHQFALLPCVIWAFVIWGALRFSQRETATIVALIVGMAVWGAIHDQGPFSVGNLDERLILLELYMAAAVLTGLALGAETSERRQALMALQDAHDKLEKRVQERTQVEAALRAKSRELEATNADLEEFAYVTSHDLQEPLRKINSFADMLVEESGGSLNETGQDYLRRMQGAARRMGRMISDLLELSRASDWTERKPVELAALLNGVLRDLEAAVAEAGAHIEVGRLGTVVVAPAAVSQVLINLLGNSLKYRRKDVALIISIEARETENNLLEVTVQDNGIGFEAQYAERIFKPFQRLHSREAYPGTGIGLAVCRKVIEKHGGTIRAEARPGLGAKFSFTLPRGKP